MTTYVAEPAEAVDSVMLDGLTALFHRPSGQTHILAPPAPQILEAIAGEGADLDVICARIAERYEVIGEPELLAARLEELESAGLVRRL